MSGQQPARLDAEQVARWVALVAAVVGVAGFALTAGAQVHPLVGWAAFALVAVVGAVRLWRDELDRRADARHARTLTPTPEPYGGPASGGGLTLPDGYGGGRG